MVSGSAERVGSRDVDPVDTGAQASPAWVSPRRAVAAIGRLVRDACDAFAYSGLLPAAVGFALTFAVTAALADEGAPSPRGALLVACSAYFVYALDRLRDLARDAAVSPRRTAFVVAHRRVLAATTGVAGFAALALVATSSASTVALCVAIGAVGLLHRRLKQSRIPKIAYVALAWTGAVVAIPALAAGRAFDAEVGVATAAIGASVLANLVASNLRAGKSLGSSCEPSLEPARDGSRALASARWLVLVVALATAFAPATVAPLAWIPAAQYAALCCFRESERFASVAVDGALFVGGVLAGARLLA